MKLNTETRRELIAQQKRQEAYAEGDYELSEDEGFTCESCGWKGLSAPMNEDWLDGEIDEEDIEEHDEAICLCPECGCSVVTHGTSEKYLAPFMPSREELESTNG